MMTKLLLLDKDGTLVAPSSGKQFVENPQDQVVLPGVREAIAYYVGHGWFPVILSNQGGVAAHHKSLKDAIAEMRYCMELLNIEMGCFCPDFEGIELYIVGPGEKEARLCAQNQGWFRKPGPGMLKWGIEYYSADIALMVGDRSEDEAAAGAAGVEFLTASQWWRR